MSAEYTRQHLRIATGKILQTIGWHTANTTPLAVLTDILHEYIFQLSKRTASYANEC